MIKPDYCTQNEGNCPTCSLSSYGRDCRNFRIFTLEQLAREITGGNTTAMAKMANDAGMVPPLDELRPDMAAFVPRPVMVELYAMRAGDIVGRRLALLLG